MLCGIREERKNSDHQHNDDFLKQEAVNSYRTITHKRSGNLTIGIPSKKADIHL